MKQPTALQQITSGILSVLMMVQSMPVMAAFSSGTNHPPAGYAGQPLPVDLRHGELTLPSEDLKVGIDALPLAVSRVYRSNLAAAQPGVFGWKWHSIVDMEVTPSVGAVSLVDETGTLREYKSQPDGSFVSVKKDYEVIAKRPDGGYDRTLKNGVTWHFDATYKLAGITDLNGRSIRIERKTVGAEKSIRLVDRYGRFITLTLNADGRVVRMMDQAGRMCLYGYNAQQDLVAFQSRAGGRMAYRYDADHRLTELNPGGYRSFFVQYKGDKVAVQKTQLGTTAVYKYRERKDGALTVSVTDGADRTTTYDYLADGTVTGTDPTGVKDSIRLNERELPVLAVGADGKRVEVEYDGRANIVSVDNGGAITRFTYAPGSDQPVRVVNPSGAVTMFDYDGRKNCVAVTGSRGGVTRLEWNKDGLLSGVIEPTGRSLKLDHDAYGQVRNTVTGDGQKTECDFTLIGLLRSVTLPTGVKINYQYDGAGQLASVNNSEGQQAFMIRNEFGQVARVVDPAGHAATFDYDPAGLLVAVTDPVGAVTRFDYDKAGNMAALSDANGNVTRWIHDAAGRLLSETDAAGGEKRVSYDQAGRPVQQTNARGQKIRMTYNPLGLLESVLSPEGTASLAYDGTGRMAGMKNACSGYEFNFTKDGLPEAVRDTKTGVATECQYDAAGRRVSMKVGDALDATYKYDGQGRLVAIAGSLGEVRFEYDGFGRRSAMVQPNGTRTEYRYDKLGRLTEQKTAWANGKEVCSYRYEYDLLGNRTAVAEGDGKATKYGYDNVSRLIRVAQGTNVTEYVYDAVGNRVGVTVNGKVERYVTGKDNRLLQAGDAKFQYDADGNMVSRSESGGETYAYRYDSENRLVEASGPKGKVCYDYAPSGGRVARTEGDLAPVRFLYDQADTVAEVQDGKVLATYLHGPGIDQPLAMQRDGKMAAYHADGLGSITRLTGTDGSVVGQYQYDAFGKLLHAENAMQNPFSYTGREWDDAANAYFYRARFYNPETGRFSSKDPRGLRQQVVAYAYCRNNPVNYLDPSGEWFGLDDLIAAGGGALLSVAATFVVDQFTGQTHTMQQYAGIAAGGAAAGETLLYTGNPIAAGAVQGCVTEATTEGLNIVSGVPGAHWDPGAILGQTVLGGVEGAIPDFIKIPGITSGRGSFLQIAKEMSTKMWEGEISHIATDTLVKMGISVAVETGYGTLQSYALETLGRCFIDSSKLHYSASRPGTDSFYSPNGPNGMAQTTPMYSQPSNVGGTPSAAQSPSNVSGMPNQSPKISYDDDSAAGLKAAKEGAASGLKAAKEGAVAGMKALSGK